MRLLLVGYGKMGQLVEQMALAQGMEIASRIDVGTGDWSAPADVAVDFSTAEALADPALQKRFSDLGLDVAPRGQQTPEGLAAFQKAEIEKWWPIIKSAGIGAQAQ